LVRSIIILSFASGATQPQGKRLFVADELLSLGMRNVADAIAKDGAERSLAIDETLVVSPPAGW